GYDHQNPEEEALMIARQEEILNQINYRREK
ncbi:MAG: rRNA maturation RNAse YbeY, partial [Acholeplasmataceae bacterium]|nr:rRNA maturation RNAse YbeY [Acholeplasmataceae bacterium]